MTYTQAMERLENSGRFGIKLGLERMETLLNALGNPQNQLKFVHIAGTNGKGSTATMLSTILIRSGYTTGLFVSPYVLCFRGRIQKNGVMISEEDFARCAAEVYACVDALGEEFEPPTQFELEVAIAFLWYRHCGCDIVCLEVGLGGRFDGTNVIAKPLLELITAIGVDHTGIWGESIEQIAFEKAGIIKGGTTVVYPLQEEGVWTVLEEQCRKKGSRLVRPQVDRLETLGDDWLEERFSYCGVHYQKSLLGTIQLYNSITVITAAEELQRQGLTITQRAMEEGIANTYVPARVEVLSRSPLVILDGSHNPDGARALNTVLRRLDCPLHLLMGVMQDKEYQDILEILAPRASSITTVTPHVPRALSAKDLAEAAEPFCAHVSWQEDMEVAVRKSLEGLKPGTALVACGSLYLAAELRPILCRVLEERKGEG